MRLPERTLREIGKNMIKILQICREELIDDCLAMIGIITAGVVQFNRMPMMISLISHLSGSGFDGLMYGP
jgi:hypothetical protein